MTVSAHTQVVRLPDPDSVAERVAGDLVEQLRALQRSGRVPSVVLTGGTISRKVHAAVARLGGDVDWSAVELWWGDERFVPADDPERNAGQATEDLLSAVPLSSERVHIVPANDGPYRDVAAAAAAYAGELRAAVAQRPDGEPWFDVLMLGIGPDGHCASLFPGRPEVDDPAAVLPVTDSPKPPPERVSMGMGTLGRAAQVWFVATGAEKAPALARSVAGGSVSATPAAGPRGQLSTAWYVDGAAAARL